MTPRIARWLKVGVGFAVSLACIAFILTRIDVDALWIALEKFQWPFLMAALVSLAVDYTLRIVRWSVMLRAAGADVTVFGCAPAFLGSMALNNVLPLRAGDVIRALVFPASLGVRRTTATASLVLERLVDLLTLLACLGIGLALAPIVRLPEWQRETLVLLTLAGASMLLLLIVFATPLARIFCPISKWLLARGHRRASLVCDRIGDVVSGLAKMSRPKTLGIVSTLSLLIWFGEAGLFLALLHGFGLQATPSMALTIMAGATLATLVPSSPGYVGPFHLAAFSAVTMIGGHEAQAAGFALVAHLALWIPVTLAGVVAILVNPGLFRRPGTIESFPQ